MTAMYNLTLDVTGPVSVRKRVSKDEWLITSCYWEGADTLLHIFDNAMLHLFSTPAFVTGDKVYVRGEGMWIIKAVEPAILPPSAIKSVWLGEIGRSKTGWALWRYLAEALDDRAVINR